MSKRSYTYRADFREKNQGNNCNLLRLEFVFSAARTISFTGEAIEIKKVNKFIGPQSKWMSPNSISHNRVCPLRLSSKEENINLVPQNVPSK